MPFRRAVVRRASGGGKIPGALRSEEHTSELQSQSNLVCRLLLEKKNNEFTDFQTAGPPSMNWSKRNLVSYVPGELSGCHWTPLMSFSMWTLHSVAFSFMFTNQA